jgi:hypothetical protein
MADHSPEAEKEDERMANRTVTRLCVTRAVGVHRAAPRRDRARAKHLWERCCRQIEWIEVGENEDKHARLSRLQDALKT